MIDIKQMVFSNLKSLSIPIKDNPTQERKQIPYGILKTINVIPENRKNYMKNNWLLRLDVFSNYKGEKEILDYYNNEIVPKVKELMKADEITYINTTCQIIDDKETGPVKKHGVISISVETMEVE